MDRSEPTRQLPLSVTQEAMWVTWQLDPAKWEHVIPIALEVDGELELPRLRAAVAQLLRRHPALGARVRRGAEGMCLDWSVELPVPVTVREVSEARAEALAAARIPFDLGTGPLARVELLTGPDWTVLLLTVHHITLDGTSIPILLDDLRRAYAGEELGLPQDLAPMLAHARRSREAAEGEAGEPLRAYWRETLADLPPAHILPSPSLPDPSLPGPWPCVVDPELAQQVRELARELGISYFTVMLGALFVTLHHHTGSPDLIVSAPYHGRSDDKELNGRVGFFVNVLPFRQRMRPSDSYQQLLLELRETVRAGLRHGTLPLLSILHSANLLGPGDRAQTDQVAFQYVDLSAGQGLDVFDFELVGESSRCRLGLLDLMDVPSYRLTVMLTEGSTGSRMLWKDSGGSVGPSVTTALARDYLTVVADMVADRSRTLAEATALLPAVAHAVRPAAEAEPAPAPLQAAAPGTVTELAAIWTRVLRVPDIRPDDSFFELGGHSLVAAQLLARIAERTGVELSVRDLFGHPRLADLAALLDSRRAGPADAPDAPAAEEQQHGDVHGSGHPGPADGWAGVFPASAFQESIWLAERLDPEHARYHIPLSWNVHGELDPDRLRAALALLVSRHEILRTRFVDDDGRLVQEIGPEWAPELDETWPGPEAEPDQREWLRKWSDAAASGFAPADGRLIAAGLFSRPSGDRLLALCVHHLVLDGESVPGLVRELDRCYQQVGQDSAAPAAPRQYRELVRAQQSGPGRERASADLEYWAARLEGAPSTLGPALAAAALPPGATALPLATDLTARLLPVQEQWQVSQFMVTAAALAAALHRWSGRTDLTFGLPVANRAGGSFGDVLGPCLNTVVLRSSCDVGTTLGELLESTRETVIGAFEHQSAPFDEVVRRLRPARSSGRTPYVDCMLNSVGTGGWSGPLGSAQLTSLENDLWDEGTNKFGLTVTFAAAEGVLLGNLAYRGGFLDAHSARQLTGDLAGILNHFHDLRDQQVFDLRLTETS